MAGRSWLIAVTLIASASAFAQSDADRLVTSALSNTRAYETLSYLTDEIGPRPSGSANAARAVAWTTDQFRAWGIDVHRGHFRPSIFQIAAHDLVGQRIGKPRMPLTQLVDPCCGLGREALPGGFMRLRSLGS